MVPQGLCWCWGEAGGVEQHSGTKGLLWVLQGLGFCVYLWHWFGLFGFGLGFLHFLPLMFYFSLGLFFLSCAVTFGPINSLPAGQALSVAQQ